MYKYNQLCSVVLIGITCLAVSGCAFGSSSGASPAASGPTSNQSSDAANALTNQTSADSIAADTNGTNGINISDTNNLATANLNDNGDNESEYAGSRSPLVLTINGNQVAPRHPVEKKSGIWFISTDDIDQIFNTYIDSSNPATVEVNLDSIVKMDFDLQTSVVTIGNTKQTLSVGAYREGKVVYLPIQTIADQCGVQIQYSQAQNQLTINSATLRFRLPLIGDQSLQTVIMPGTDQNAPVQILGENGQMLLTTAGQQVPIVGMRFFQVGARFPLVLLILQGGTGGQLYTAYMYDAAVNQFQTVPWGSDPSSSTLGFVGYNADTQTISLSQRTYDAVHHIATTIYKWTAESGASVGRLEAVSTSYGPVATSSNLPQSPEMLLEAALTSVAEHLPQETNLYFVNPADGTAFYEKWEPVFPYGDSVSFDMSKWSNQEAASGKPQTVVVTTTGSKGEKKQYSCTVVFQTQGENDRIRSIELTPITN